MDLLVEHRKYITTIGIIGSIIAGIGLIVQLFVVSGFVLSWIFDTLFIGVIIITSSVLISIGCLALWNRAVRPFLILTIITYFASSIVGILWTFLYAGGTPSQFNHLWRIQATLSAYSFILLMISYSLKKEMVLEVKSNLVEPMIYFLYFVFLISSLGSNLLLPSYFISISIPLNFFSIIFFRDFYQTADFY